MSRKDFEQCTPLEFSKIVEKHNALEESRFREGWERTRAEVILITNNIFSKNALKFPLPWDDNNTGATRAVPKGTSSPERMKEVLGRLKK